METLLKLKEKHREMVRMEMAGKGRKEIGEAVGMNEQVVGRILNHDEKADEYRQELIKEKERIVKRSMEQAQLRMKSYVEDFVKVLHDIALYGKEHSTRLNACVKGLQFAGMKLDGVEEKMTQAPRIVIRDSSEKVKDDGVKKPSEDVGDEIQG